MTGGQITTTLDLLQCLSTRNPTIHMPLNCTNNCFFIEISSISNFHSFSIYDNITILQDWNFTSCSNSQIDLDAFLHGCIMLFEIPASQYMIPSQKLRNYKLFFHRSNLKTPQLPSGENCQKHLTKAYFNLNTRLVGGATSP